jgi:hypothetical protein
MLSQPAEIVPAGVDLAPITVAVAMSLDAPQLFVHAHIRSAGVGGAAEMGGLYLTEVRAGIADFHKLRITLPEHAQAAQLQLVFTLCAVVAGKLQQLDASINAISRPFFVASTHRLAMCFCFGFVVFWCCYVVVSRV